MLKELRRKVYVKVMTTIAQVVEPCRHNPYKRPEEETVLCSLCREDGGWPRCKRSRQKAMPVRREN